MLIGIDFDNTIVCWDEVFYRAALERRLISSDIPVGKRSVRDYFRRTGQGNVWTELQGYVYGVLIREAPMFPGVYDFFMYCKKHRISVAIISHKTRYPVLGKPYDLHQAAHEWLKTHGFYKYDRVGLSSSNVFFELTKQDKLDRIAQIGCTHFVDDLPEFLMEPRFPSGVERILFDPKNDYQENGHFYRAKSWQEIEQWLIGTNIPS